MFERWSTSLPSACSGDRYSATPNTVSDTGTGATKLITFTSSFAATSTFLGDRSWWTTPTFWPSSSASPICATIALARSSGSGPLAATSCSSGCPSQSSLAMNRRPLGVLAEVDHARELRALRRAAAASARAARAPASASSAAKPARRACRRRSRRSACRAPARPRRCANRRAAIPSGSAPAAPRTIGSQTPRALGRGAPLLRAEVSVVGILGLTVRAEFHPVGRVDGTGSAAPRSSERHVTSQSAREKQLPHGFRDGRVRDRAGDRNPELLRLGGRRPGLALGRAPCPRTARPRWASTSCSPWPCASCPRYVLARTPFPGNSGVRGHRAAFYHSRVADTTPSMRCQAPEHAS